MMLQIREKGNIREERNGEKMMRWDLCPDSPHRQLHSQVPVDGDGQESQDRGMRDDHHQAAHEQAGVEMDDDSQAHHDSQWCDKDPHGNVSECQGNDVKEGGLLKSWVQLHRPDHQGIAHHCKYPNNRLRHDIDHIQAA